MCTVAAFSQCIFRRTAIHSVPPSFSEDPDILRDLVHLEEDFVEGGLEVEPLACVRRSVCGMLHADDAGIVPKSTKNLAKMSVIVTVFESADLTVPKTKTETMLLRTLNKVVPAPPLFVEAAGQRYTSRPCIIYTWARSYQGKRRYCAINQRRIRLAWACYNRFQAGRATIVSSGTCYDRFKRDMPQRFQAGTVPYGRCFVHTKIATANDRSDGHPAVRARGSESRPGALR